MTNSNSFPRHIFLRSAAAAFLFAFAAIMPAEGKEISARKALGIAKRYVTLEKKAYTAPRTRSVTGSADVEPFYIFNDAKGRGFVVVSGDDALGEVLAYSHSGRLDTLHTHPGVQFLLEGYRESFAQLKNHPAAQTVAATRAAGGGQRVAPMLRSEWNQDAPYNLKTGYDYTGCVATAMAQLMYYHKWPAQGKGQNSYRVTYDGTMKSADFSQSHYDWDNMLPTYKGIYPRATAAQENAVAQLMSDVGIAVFMQYTPSSSGSQNINAYRALKNNFDYSAAYVTKADEGIGRFTDILRKELLSGFPVYLSGDPKRGSGHAWVTDGFDGDGLFHMNFGWGGSADGYFSLRALNLSQTGNEFGGKPLTFGYRLTAILAHPNKTGIDPVDADLLEENPNLAFTAGGRFVPAFGDGHIARTSKIEVQMSGFTNQSSDVFVGDIGVGLFDEQGTLLHVFPSNDHDNGGFTQQRFGLYNEGKMPSGGLVDEVQTLKVDLQTLAAGRYRLVPMCATLAGGQWGTWVRMKKAPNIELQLSESQIRVTEASAASYAFQLAGQPQLNRLLTPGDEVKVTLPIKNLYGVGMDAFVRLSLVDENDVEVASARSRSFDFESFGTTSAMLNLKVGATVAPKRYRVKLTLVKDEGQSPENDATAPHYSVRDLHNFEAAYITVDVPEKTSPIRQVTPYVQDNAGDGIPGTGINLKQNSLLKFGCLFSIAEGRSFNGELSLSLEDEQSGQIIPLTTLQKDYHLSSNEQSNIITVWVKTSTFAVLNNRRYRLVLQGKTAGTTEDLWPAQQPPFYLTFEDSRYTTGISSLSGSETEAVSSPVVLHDGHRIEVRGTHLREADLFNVSGQLLKRSTAPGQDSLLLSISDVAPGVYLLRIVADGKTSTHRFLKEDAE